MIRKIKRILEKNKPLQNRTRKIYLATIFPLVTRYRKWQQAERPVSWGRENADKTFYVIRRCDEKCGLFAWIHVFMGHLAYAEKNGWIPVIDMQSYPNPFLEEDEIKKINAWDFFFRQPAGFSLSDIKKSKNIVLSNMFPIGNFLEGDIYTNDEKKKELVRLRKKYIFMHADIEKKVENLFSTIIGKEKTLGLLCRGTDYLKLKPKGHQIQPNLEQIENQLKKSMKETGCTQIYLCTEDKTIFEALKKSFGDKLKVYERDFVEYDGGFIIDNNTKVPQSKKSLSYHYLIQIAILAKLDFILAGRSGGTIGAIILSNGFEYEYFWDIGVYS